MNAPITSTVAKPSLEMTRSSATQITDPAKDLDPRRISPQTQNLATSDGSSDVGHPIDLTYHPVSLRRCRCGERILPWKAMCGFCLDFEHDRRVSR